MTKNKQFASMEELMPLMRESLHAGQKVKFSPRGKSMLPLLRAGKDSVILTKAEAPLKPYDIALYQRADGKYILHRIVGVAERRGETIYTCLGDNQLALEFGIRHDQIIAVVCGFYRGDRLHGVDERGYRIYGKIWYQIRRVARFARRLLRKIVG